MQVPNQYDGLFIQSPSIYLLWSLLDTPLPRPRQHGTHLSTVFPWIHRWGIDDSYNCRHTKGVVLVGMHSAGHCHVIDYWYFITKGTPCPHCDNTLTFAIHLLSANKTLSFTRASWYILKMILGSWSYHSIYVYLSGTSPISHQTNVFFKVYLWGQWH